MTCEFSSRCGVYKTEDKLCQTDGNNCELYAFKLQFKKYAHLDRTPLEQGLTVRLANETAEERLKEQLKL